MRVNISGAKQRLSMLVDAATSETELVILRNGKPVAKLVPVRRSRQRRGLRKFGIAKGKYNEAEIDAAFTPEVDAEIAKMLEGDLDS